MKISKREITEYIFDENDFKTIQVCIGYCAHRLREHNHCGIDNIEKKALKLHEEININNLCQ